MHFKITHCDLKRFDIANRDNTPDHLLKTLNINHSVGSRINHSVGSRDHTSGMLIQ